jgi:predicted N-acetyltransferase YhbS
MDLSLPEAQMPQDQPLIENILDLGFGLSRRTKTSYRLREGSEPVDGLSMVIRDAELGVAGTISYWPLLIGEAATPALLLGPLAVHPERQNQGYGRLLMAASLKRARELGHGLVLLVGDAPYYQQAGFLQVPAGQLDLPGPFDPKRLMFLELQSGALAPAHGLVLAAWRRR